MLILLADDERLIRLGLQSMIEELFPAQHTFLHARNGNEVVAILKKQSPDLAFLDIKMPLMNGLEALKICKELSTSTIWIILSGYADFEYAREAVSLATFDYILKPVELDTLKNLFQRIEIKHQISNKQNNRIFAHDVIRSFNMADQFSAKDTEFLPSESSDYILYQFYIDYLNQAIQKEIKQTLCKNLQFFCENNVSIINYCIFFNTDGNLCLICDAPDASRLTHFIKMQLDALPQNAFSVFWGNRKTIHEIYDISQRISRVADIRLFRSCCEPTFIKNIELMPSLTSLLVFARKLTAILNLYITQNKNSFSQNLSSLKEQKDFVSLFSLIDTTVLSHYLSSILGNAVSICTYNELIELLEFYETSLKLPTLSASANDIDSIKNYIRQNFANDVSISYISEQFNLSPSYFSKLFHEKTGQKYIDFVTQIRMEEAKKILLQNPSISVKQAAELVGYSSVRHFSKTFQKYTGTLPSNFHIETD